MANTRSKVEPIAEIPYVSPIVYGQSFEKKEQKVEVISSIEKAQDLTSVPYTPSKPSLEKPKGKNSLEEKAQKTTSAVIDFIRELLSLEDQKKGLENCRTTASKRQFTEVEENFQAECKAMKEALANQNNADYWSFFGDLSNTFSNSISMFLGASLISSGSTILGATFIAVGVLGVTSTIFKYTGGWDWLAGQFFPNDEQAKQQIALMLPIAIGIVTTILGISGGIGAYYYQQLGDFDRILTILQTASSIASGTTKIGSSVAESRVISSNAKLSFLQSMGSLSKMELENLLESLSTLFDNQVQINELAGEIVKATIEQIQMTQQTV